MSQLEDALGAMLNDPNLMQQIAALAQSLGANTSVPPEQARAPAPPEKNGPDPKMLQALAGFARQNNVDSDQQTLLQALRPYLSRERLDKLERAMRAARLAGAASGFLNAGGLQLLTGR